MQWQSFVYPPKWFCVAAVVLANSRTALNEGERILIFSPLSLRFYGKKKLKLPFVVFSTTSPSSFFFGGIYAGQEPGMQR